MSADIKALLQELRSNLKVLYGSRLIEVYLYGSYARHEADPESDVDVLIVLDDLAGYGVELDRTGHLVSDLSLKYGVSISRVFVTASDWSRRNSPFLINVRAEAIPA